MIFAALVQYGSDVPGVAKFKLLGVPMTEKWFTYLMASSLMLMQNGSSALTCAFGALIGILYKSRGSGLSRFRFPSSLQRLATHLFHPILSITDHTAGPRVPTSSSDQGRPHNRNPTDQPDLFANRANMNDNFEAIPPHLLNQVQPTEANIALLVEMGFSRERASRALAETGDSVELALATLTADD